MRHILTPQRPLVAGSALILRVCARARGCVCSQDLGSLKSTCGGEGALSSAASVLLTQHVYPRGCLCPDLLLVGTRKRGTKCAANDRRGRREETPVSFLLSEGFSRQRPPLKRRVMI